MPQSNSRAALKVLPLVNEGEGDAPDHPPSNWVNQTPGVDAHSDTQTPERPDTQTPKGKCLVKRRGGRVRRRRTMYMPPDLDARLAAFCHENHREVSETIAAAVELYLDKRGA